MFYNVSDLISRLNILSRTLLSDGPVRNAANRRGSLDHVTVASSEKLGQWMDRIVSSAPIRRNPSELRKALSKKTINIKAHIAAILLLHYIK